MWSRVFDGRDRKMLTGLVLRGISLDSVLFSIRLLCIRNSVCVCVCVCVYFYVYVYVTERYPCLTPLHTHTYTHTQTHTFTTLLPTFRSSKYHRWRLSTSSPVGAEMHETSPPGTHLVYIVLLPVHQELLQLALRLPAASYCSCLLPFHLSISVHIL